MYHVVQQDVTKKHLIKFFGLPAWANGRLLWNNWLPLPPLMQLEFLFFRNGCVSSDFRTVCVVRWTLLFGILHFHTWDQKYILAVQWVREVPLYAMFYWIDMAPISVFFRNKGVALYAASMNELGFFHVPLALIRSHIFAKRTRGHPHVYSRAGFYVARFSGADCFSSWNVSKTLFPFFCVAHSEKYRILYLYS